MNYFRRFIPLFLIFILLTFNSTAQTVLFTDAGSDTRAQNAPQPRGALRTRAVHVNLDALSQPNPTFNLFDDATFTATQTATGARPSGAAGYVWNGIISDQPYSSVTLIVSPHGLFGQVNLLDSAYSIETHADGLTTISQIQIGSHFNESADDGLPVPPAPLTRSATPRGVGIPGSADSDSGAIIDVLVLYTPAAAATGAITDKIDSMITVTNNSYADSAVNQRLRLIHSQQIGYTEPGSTIDSLYHLTYRKGEVDFGYVLDPVGFLDKAQKLRESHAADLVVLIAKNNDPYCGLAWVLNSVDPNMISFQQKYGFAVVDVDCWSPFYTFAHELGHTMGGVHDVANASSPGVFNYAYGYQDPSQAFVTIMAYPVRGNCPNPNNNWFAICTPIGRWSDPTGIPYNGKAVGNASTNMRRTLNNTAVYVANFRLAKLDPFDLSAPSNGAVITDPAVTFQWGDTPNAATYTLNVTNSTGFLYSKVLDDASVCDGVTCTFDGSTDPAWNPPDTVLNWRVTARNTSGSRTRSSVKWQISPDFLPDTLAVTEPANNAIFRTLDIPFAWLRDARVGEYRLRVVDPGGFVLLNSWIPAADVCDDTTCSVVMELTDGIKVKGGVYTWQLFARRDGVKTVVKTIKFKFTLAPRILQLTPAGGEIMPSRDVTVTWEENTEFPEYRIKYRKLPSGTTLIGTWQSGICAVGVCELTQTFPRGKIEWWVEGRRPNYVGLIKSPRRNFVTP